MQRFPIAPMSPMIRALTLFLLALPVVFGLAVVFKGAPLPVTAVGIFLALLCATVWLWWRPSRFEVDHGTLRIVFPARRLEIPLSSVTGCRVISYEGFHREFGWAARVGVGGLWGGFGRLWTSRRGWVQFYISRVDRFLVVERRSASPLLLTPTDCDAMAATLRETGTGPATPTIA